MPHRAGNGTWEQSHLKEVVQKVSQHSAHHRAGAVGGVAESQADQEDGQGPASGVGEVLRQHPHEIPAGDMQQDEHKGGDHVCFGQGIALRKVSLNRSAHEQLLEGGGDHQDIEEGKIKPRGQNGLPLEKVGDDAGEGNEQPDSPSPSRPRWPVGQAKYLPEAAASLSQEPHRGNDPDDQLGGCPIDKTAQAGC